MRGFWEQAGSGAVEAEQVEDVLLQGGGLGDVLEVEGKGAFVFLGVDAADILVAGPQFLEQGVKTVDGPAVVGMARVLLVFGRRAGLGGGHGVARPTRLSQFLLFWDGVLRKPFGGRPISHGYR